MHALTTHRGSCDTIRYSPNTELAQEWCILFIKVVLIITKYIYNKCWQTPTQTELKVSFSRYRTCLSANKVPLCSFLVKPTSILQFVHHSAITCFVISYTWLTKVASFWFGLFCSTHSFIPHYYMAIIITYISLFSLVNAKQTLIYQPTFQLLFKRLSFWRQCFLNFSGWPQICGLPSSASGVADYRMHHNCPLRSIDGALLRTHELFFDIVL